jgi:hypothetical protein
LRQEGDSSLCDRQELWNNLTLPLVEEFQVDIADTRLLELFIATPGNPAWAQAAWVDPLLGIKE